MNVLRDIVGSDTPPAVFWSSFANALSQLAGARFTLITLQTPGQADAWKKIAAWPPRAPAVARSLLEVFALKSEEANTRGRLLEPLADSSFLAAVRLDTGEGEADCVALLCVESGSDGRMESIMERLELASLLPRTYRQAREAARLVSERDRVAGALNYAAEVNSHPRFLKAAMAWCNALAGGFTCDRVSFGWQKEGRYVRLAAISNMERFDRKMDAVAHLEHAMEECLDQDEEIVLPNGGEGRQIIRDHEMFARNHGGPYLLSVPMGAEGEDRAVVLLERSEAPFSEEEVSGVRVAADLVAPRLADLKRDDRWFGARWADRARGGLARFVGVRHTWVKLLAVGVLVGILVLAFGKKMYRVEAPFLLRTDEVRFLHAPFDGYVESVHVQIGDRLSAGQVLLRFDTADLRLEEASAAAEQTRYRREAEKALAGEALAEMRVARSLAKQADARLQIVRHRLAQAEVKSPFDAVLVEGDFQEKVGAPVRGGDPLFHLARLEGMHIRCEVRERDIHEVREGQTGRIAFASRPETRFPFVVERIEPQAETRPDGNVFELHGRVEADAVDWWRPGMSGVARIDIEKRNLFWIFTHRTTDWLRLRLWW